MMIEALPAGDYREKLVDLFFEKFQSKFAAQQLIDLAVPSHDRYFTDEEIKDLIQFYQTPLGQKAITTLPQLTQEPRESGQKMGEKIGQDSMMEVLDEHPELKKQLEDTQKP